VRVRASARCAHAAARTFAVSMDFESVATTSSWHATSPTFLGRLRTHTHAREKRRKTQNAKHGASGAARRCRRKAHAGAPHALFLHPRLQRGRGAGAGRHGCCCGGGGGARANTPRACGAAAQEERAQPAAARRPWARSACCAAAERVLTPRQAAANGARGREARSRFAIVNFVLARIKGPPGAGVRRTQRARRRSSRRNAAP
jgi:hypothetical protein